MPPLAWDKCRHQQTMKMWARNCLSHLLCRTQVTPFVHLCFCKCSTKLSLSCSWLMVINFEKGEPACWQHHPHWTLHRCMRTVTKRAPLWHSAWNLWQFLQPALQAKQTLVQLSQSWVGLAGHRHFSTVHCASLRGNNSYERNDNITEISVSVTTLSIQKRDESLSPDPIIRQHTTL